MVNIKESIEIFHLVFLHHLENKIDKSLYSIKGGCNLRFFFNSIRYSEDIDFDVRIINKETLRTKISKLLTNHDFKNSLQSRQIMIGQISEPKQTETTQRWKLGLKVNNFSTLIPTKIEFSKITNFSQEETAFTKINPQLTQKYKMYPIMANHYTLQAALNQKINALINRTETQARDVFDLQLLIDAGALPKDIWPDLINKLSTAITNLVNIDFAMFKSQVVAYLLPEYQKLYDKPENWQQIQEQLSYFLTI